MNSNNHKINNTRQDGCVVDGDANNSEQASEMQFPRDIRLVRMSGPWMQKRRTLIQVRVIVTSIHCFVGCSISVRIALHCFLSPRYVFYRWQNY